MLIVNIAQKVMCTPLEWYVLAFKVYNDVIPLLRIQVVLETYTGLLAYSDCKEREAANIVSAYM